MTVTFNEETHTYTTETGIVLPSVTRILEVSGFRQPYRGPAIYGERGKYVHKATELIDEGDLAWDDVVPEWRGYCEAYALFLDENEVEILATEQMVWHPVLMYAGILDRRMKFNRRNTVLDFKTGAPHKSDIVQAAAYDEAFTEMDKGFLMNELRLLYLKKNGAYQLLPETQDDVPRARMEWSAAVTILNYHRRK